MNTLMVKDIHKQYGDTMVLKGISFSAKKGDVISLIGSSGSGKSTLLRCINFLEIPNSGTVQLDDISLGGHLGQGAREARSQLQRLRMRVAMVFQHFNLWAHMTVMENVSFAQIHVAGASRQAAAERADFYLRKVGIGPDLYGSYPAHLSGGQQQRVAIARALAIEPEIMLFDEPTSALDPERVDEILAIMQQLASEGRTMIVVTHEMAFARKVSTKTIFLHEGRIETEGTPTEVFGECKSERLKKFLSPISQ